MSLFLATLMTVGLIAGALAAISKMMGMSVQGLLKTYLHVGSRRKAPDLSEPEPDVPAAVRQQPPQLGEQFSKSTFLKRKEFGSLIEYIENVPSGNIAIAGHRGVGKSTLMNGLVSDSAMENYVRVSVASPTRYEEKDFVLNLFEGLCYAVLDRIFVKAGFDVDRARQAQIFRAPGYSRTERTKQVMVVGSLLVLLVVTLQASLIRDLLSTGGFGTQTVGIVLLVLGGLATFFLLMQFATAFRPTEVEIIRARSVPLARLYLETERRLERIGFQQTYEQSASAEVSLNSLLKLGGSSGQSLLRQPYTLVGLIADYREYVEMVVDEFDKVVICLDELDKVLDPEEARLFLRKIKGVFSLSHVYYVVSVSEEALEAFKLRSIRGKDEVDSTFTTVLTLDGLTVSECRELLALRHANVGPLANVLAVLSAGSPRDLIRLARELCLSSAPESFTAASYLVQAAGNLMEDVVKDARRSDDIDDQVKYIVGSHLRNDLVSSPASLLAEVRAAINEIGQYRDPPEGNRKMTEVLHRLGVQLEVLSWLVDHTAVFDDDALCRQLQAIMALVVDSPLEAERHFLALRDRLS